jgi:hypothetical protein
VDADVWHAVLLARDSGRIQAIEIRTFAAAHIAMGGRGELPAGQYTLRVLTLTGDGTKLTHRTREATT